MHFWKTFLQMTGWTNFLIRRDGKEAVATIAEDLAAVRALKENSNLEIAQIRTLLLKRHNGSPELTAAIHDLDEAMVDEEVVGSMDAAFYLSYIEEHLLQASFNIFQFAIA